VPEPYSSFRPHHTVDALSFASMNQAWDDGSDCGRKGWVSVNRRSSLVRLLPERNTGKSSIAIGPWVWRPKLSPRVGGTVRRRDYIAASPLGAARRRAHEALAGAWVSLPVKNFKSHSRGRLCHKSMGEFKTPQLRAPVPHVHGIVVDFLNQQTVWSIRAFVKSQGHVARQPRLWLLFFLLLLP
jgi:hypothetical protein